MKLDRKNLYFVINVFLLVVCFAVCVIIVAKAKKSIIRNTFRLYPKVNEQQLLWSREEIDKLRTDNKNLIISFEHSQSGTVSHGFTNVFTRMMLIDSDYFFVNHFDFIYGAGWNGSKDNESLAVVNEILAWKLFGSADVVGNEIKFRNTTHKIVGVVKQEKNAEPLLWTTCKGIDENERIIENLIIKVPEYNAVASYLNIKSMLENANKQAESYYIADLNYYVHSMSSRLIVIQILALVLFFIEIVFVFRRYIKNLSKWKMVFSGIMLTLCAFVIFVLISKLQFSDWIMKPFDSIFEESYIFLFNVDKLPSGSYLNGNMLKLLEHNSTCTFLFITSIVSLLNMFFVNPFAKKKQ